MTGGQCFVKTQKRQRELELERAAKRKKLNETGQQVSNLNLKEMMTKRKNHQLKLAHKLKSLKIYSALSTLTGNHFDRWEFVQNEEKVKFYTGLPSFNILQNVFEPVSPFVAYKSQNLTTFQEFVMTLLILKLDTPQQDLS